MVPSTLMGRETHLTMLADVVNDAARGIGRTVTVVGGVGSGKTALLDAVAEASDGAFHVLRVSGHPAEQDLPLAGVHQLMHRAGFDLGLPGEAHATDLHNAVVLLEKLRDLAQRRPVILIVDDAQWLDRDSHRALVFVARRLEGVAACVFFSVREPVREHLSVGTELNVGSLSFQASVDLLRRWYPSMNARVAARVATAAHGVPLALREIPADLTEAQRLGTAPLPDHMPIGKALSRHFGERIKALPNATRLALLGASFEDTSPDEYASLLTDLGVRLEDLDVAERLGFVRVRGGRCSFLHPLGAAAMREAARSQELVTVHRAIARQVVDDPVKFASHVRHDPDVPPVELLRVLKTGAEEADRRRRYGEAAELFVAAASHAQSPDERHTLKREAIRCFAMAGAGLEVLALVEQMMTDSASEVERARILREFAWVSLWTGSGATKDDGAVEAHSAKLLTSVEPETLQLGRNLLAALATATFGTGEYRRAHEMSRALIAHAGDHLTAEQALLCDVIAVMVGAPGAGTLLRNTDEWIDDYPWRHILDPGSPTGFVVAVLGWLGEYEIFERALAHCMQAINDYGPSTSAQYITSSMNAARERYRGNWDEALIEFQAIEQVLTDSDFVAPYPFVSLRHAHLLAARGDRSGCERARARAREGAPDWIPSLAHLDHAVAGLLALAHRDFTEALEHLDKAAHIEQRVGLVTSGYLSRAADTFEAAWRLGDTASRISELERFERDMQAVQHMGMLGLVARCRALLAPPDDMDRQFALAVDLLSFEPDGFEVARTRLLWGERLRRARRKADAYRTLTDAQDTFIRLGATAWAGQCASELAACGARRAGMFQRGDSPAAQLTPREFEVASEVARGLSNAETARRLFISERTVEFHLYNVFRKFGIESRTALGSFLTDSGNPSVSD